MSAFVDKMRRLEETVQRQDELLGQQALRIGRLEAVAQAAKVLDGLDQCSEGVGCGLTDPDCEWCALDRALAALEAS